MPSKTRCAVYARVSTRGNGQDPETQLIPLRDYAGHRGFEIAGEYVDIGISGAKDRRPELDRLMTDARRREFDAILVARFDRFARSAKHLVLALEEFQALGIDCISLSESVDTSTPMGKMVFTVIGAVAELERSLIRKRVVMGLQKAKRPEESHFGCLPTLYVTGKQKDISKSQLFRPLKTRLIGKRERGVPSVAVP